MRSANGTDLPDGLDGADLIVGVHHCDKAGFRADGGFHFFRKNDAVLMHIQQGHLKAFGLQLSQGMKDSMMFEGGGNDMRLSFSLTREGCGTDGLVIRL